MKKKLTIVSAIIASILVVTACVYCGIRFIQQNKIQNVRIDNLYNQIHLLDGRTHELSDRYWEVKESNQEHTIVDDSFDWLAIGNSLTLIIPYGHGICSTKVDNDYFALVKKYLKEEYPSVNAQRLNFSDWERSNNRYMLHQQIDSYLSPSTDLVTIQLGENVYDLSTYKEDLILLVEHIHYMSPYAQIVMIDDFWFQETSDIRKAVADELGIGFADLSEIRGKKEYQSKEGIEFILSDGTTSTVSKEAETHPGDEGMEYIAKKISEQIKK